MPRVADVNSCGTCRRRKVRCDGGVPTCDNCIRRNVYCDRQRRLSVKHYAPKVVTATNVDDQPRKLLQQSNIAQLFHVYIKELAPWYDLNDEQRAFEREGAQKALDSPLLFSAAIAFAAIYLHRKLAFPRNVAERYHERCLQILIALSSDDEAVKDGSALASTCLLRSYEILAEDEDPNRHLFGASTLVPATPSLADHSLLASGFWNYLREDITYSLIHECPLKVQIDQICMQAHEDDEFANNMTLLLGRAVNVCYGNTKDDLFPEIIRWRKTFDKHPFSRTEGVFPVIKMLKDCQVAAMHYYLVARCLLEPENRQELAADICGLAMAADSDPVVVNFYGPSACVGKWLKSGEQRSTLVTFLKSTTRKTGWNVDFLTNGLIKQWALADSVDSPAVRHSLSVLELIE